MTVPAIVVLRPLQRAALALPNLLIADVVAAEWGESVWTHPTAYRAASLLRTPVSLADLRLGQLDPRPAGCRCSPVGTATVVLEPTCPLHGHLTALYLAEWQPPARDVAA